MSKLYLESSLDKQYIMLSADAEGNIIMQSPIQFFHMDQKFAYNGEVTPHLITTYRFSSVTECKTSWIKKLVVKKKLTKKLKLTQIFAELHL